MTAAVPTPDLQRIVEALKACRERYRIYAGERLDLCSVWDVTVQPLGRKVFQGSPSACHDWRDARCAEAMVRAIVPAELVALAGKAAGGTWSWEGTLERPAPGEHWRDQPTIYAGRVDPIAEFGGMPMHGHGLNLFGRLDPDSNGRVNLDLTVAAVNLVRSLSVILGETQP